MEEPTQEQLDRAKIEFDEANRRNEVVYKHEVMKAVKDAFCSANATLKNRSSYDQTVMGNMLTVIELELKKDLKNLTSKTL